MKLNDAVELVKAQSEENMLLEGLQEVEYNLSMDAASVEAKVKEAYYLVRNRMAALFA